MTTCYCYRLPDPHEHSANACTSCLPVASTHRTPGASEAEQVEVEVDAGFSISAMSIATMQEQAAEEANWIEKLRPIIERDLRRRIADEIEHDPVRGVAALRNLYVLGMANSAEKGVLRPLEAIRLQIEHWLCGIRDGSVGRAP